MTQSFLSYLRVSTNRQGHDGLGIEAQREAVRRYCDQIGAELLGEFVEVETGKNSDRPVLAEALAACRSQKATLAIAKLDRLSRSVSFIAGLMDAKTPFVAVDMPFATPLVLHVMAAFAEHERIQIAARTKAALAAAKARGVKLGTHGAVLAAQHKASATAFAMSVAPHIAAARSSGATTLRALADYLNATGVPTREGSTWYPASVGLVVKRLAPPESDIEKLGDPAEVSVREPGQPTHHT